jgi:hypothetical protein
MIRETRVRLIRERLGMMKLAAIGTSWRFNGAGVPLSDFELPDHVAEYLMLRDRNEVERRFTAAIQFAAADAVCLPGSAVPSEDGLPPRWLIALSQTVSRVIVVETFDTWGNTKTPSKPGTWKQTRKGWIIANGKVAKGPVHQRIVTGDDAADAEKLGTLAHELIGGERCAALRPSCSGIVLLCGEINVVAGGGPVPPRDLRTQQLNDWWEAEDELVTFNPTHTWMKPQASRDKRAWLSEKGALLAPMNAHDSGPNWQGSKSAGYIVVDGDTTNATVPDGFVDGNDAGYATARIAVVDI